MDQMNQINSRASRSILPQVRASLISRSLPVYSLLDC